jgi:hypothetical protein
MSFEMNIVMQRLVLPAIFAMVGCYLLARTDQGEDWYDDERVRGLGFPTLLGAFLCGLGLVVSDFWSRGILGQPEVWGEWKASYQWQWMVWMIPGSMLLFAITRTIFGVPIQYGSMAALLTCSLAVAVLFVCLNEGVVWQDQSDKLMPWLAAGLVAVVWNVHSMNAIARSGGSRWNTLIATAQLGCVAVIAMQAYASLGLWATAGIGTAIGATVVGLAKGSTAKLYFGWQLSTVVIPMLMMAAGVLVVSRFFETTSVPVWLVWSALFLPSLAGLADLVFGRLSSPWVRPFFAALVCGGILGWLIFLAMSNKPEW